ncbi:MAG TPA: phosphoenolpyruvate-utilizing N-terminal domain-containing protein, partial [Tichowtungia sp.]|nr:phosphoenolpyruvate-utilizing N-terminal domain-containing protein [Tichowtungia sp.]
MKTLRGIGVSPGYASGRIVIYRSLALDTVQSRPIEPGNIETEFERFIEAAEHAQEELSVVREQVAADVGESEAAIFDAHIAMLSDSSLKQNMHERLRTSRICAEAAVAAEVRAFASRLASSNCAYMHELATDIHDVGNRLLRHLYLDEGQNPLAELPPNSVIMARDLMPSE